MRNALIAALILLLTACELSQQPADTVAVALPPEVAPDPAIGGSLTIESVDYEFGRMLVSDEETGSTYETDVHGYVTYPADDDGPFPVLLIQHGRHQTCETTVGQLPTPFDDDNCPDGVFITHADSYRGYDYLVRALATNGYVVISIDTNDVNDNDGSSNAGDAGMLARAELILRHLDAFQQINLQGGSGLNGLRGRMDFGRIGMMGHSRGGEGIVKAALLNAQRQTPYALRGLFALAPTAFDHRTVTDIPYATLLPYCDGDVSSLHGAYVFDTSRDADDEHPQPRFQILAMGANHNYFNTVWTSDDWLLHGSRFDPHCGPAAATSQRDSEAGQRALGQFFIASFLRYFVGGEAEFGAYWSGQSGVPASACPEGVAPCDARYHLSIQPPPARRLTIDATSPQDALTHNALDLPVRFEEFSSFGICTANGSAGDGCAISDPTFSTADMLYLQWAGPARYVSELAGLDASAYDTLSLRVGVSVADDANSAGQDFSIVLTDKAGHAAAVSAAAFSDALFDPPGRTFDRRGAAKTTLNAVRIPLHAFADVNLTALQSVVLEFDRTDAGTVQLTDLMLQRLSP